MTTDYRLLAARTFVLLCGGPESPSMDAAVMAWLIQENGPGTTITRNNPWNLHSSGGLPGQTGSVYVGPGDTNVAVFDTLQHGVAACVANLKAHGSDFAHYDAVLVAVKYGNAEGFLDALARSAWSAGHYGGPGASNQLIPIYRRLTAGMPAPEAAVKVTDPYPKFLDLAAGVQLYATDGKTPLVKMSSAAAGLYSPFGNGMQRAVVITTGGVTQIAFVLTTIATNVRPYSAATASAWTVNGKPVSSGSVTY